MDTSLVIVLLALAAGVGLCFGYLIGHTAAFNDGRHERRGKAAQRHLDALGANARRAAPYRGDGWDAHRAKDREDRDTDLAIGVRYHR